MSSRQIIQDAERFQTEIYNEYMMFFLGLLHNTLEVENLPEDVPKRYFLRILFKYGKIGYGNNLYLPVSGHGIDIYGLPTEYVFTAANGIVFTKKAEDCVILRINDQAYPIIPFLQLKCKELATIETSIYQNLFAVRTQAVYECADQASLLSLQQAYKSRKLGAEVMFQTSAMVGTTKLTVHKTEAEYLGADLNELKKEVYDEVLDRLGMMTANTQKKERVQTAEVNASIGLTHDSIYVMVDTFNHDAEIGGLDIRLKLHASIEDYYETIKATQGDMNIPDDGMGKDQYNRIQ